MLYTGASVMIDCGRCAVRIASRHRRQSPTCRLSRERSQRCAVSDQAKATAVGWVQATNARGVRSTIAETMSDTVVAALIGVGGIIVGTAIAGGMTLLQARRERRERER